MRRPTPHERQRLADLDPRVDRLRVPGARRVGAPNDRAFAFRAARIEDHADALNVRLGLLGRVRREWEAEAQQVAEPFGMDWRTLPPEALDLLAWTTPDGEHWRWDGRTNNKGLPVMRIRTHESSNTEWGATRWLHRMLAPDHEPPGAMHPRCDMRRCVRLQHRCPQCFAIWAAAR